MSSENVSTFDKPQRDGEDSPPPLEGSVAQAMPEGGVEPAGVISLRQLFGDTLVYGMASVADRAIGFLLLPVITAILNPEDYGIISLFTTTAHILFILCSLGIHQGFFRHYTESTDIEHQNSVLNTTLSLAVMYWLCVLPVFLLAGETLNRLIFGLDGSSLALALAASMLIQVIDSVASNRLQADGRRWTYFGVVVTSSVVLRTTAILLVLGGMGAWGWVLSDTLGRLIAVMLLVVVAMPDAKLRPNAKLVWPVASYGVMLVPALLSFYIMIVADKYLIRALLPDALEQVGFYSVGERIAGIMQLVNLAFIFGWQRFAFRNMHLEEGPRVIGRGILWFAVAGSYLSLCLSMLGDDLTHWLIAAQYAPGIVVIIPLTLAALLGGLASTAEVGLHKRKKPLHISGLNGMAALLNIGLNLWAIPRWGIAGAAYATMVSQLFRCVFIWRASQQAFPMPLEIGRVGQAIGLFFLVYFCGQLLNPLPLWVATLGQTLLLLVTPLLLWMSGFFTPEERETVFRALRMVRSTRL